MGSKVRAWPSSRLLNFLTLISRAFVASRHLGASAASPSPRTPVPTPVRYRCFNETAKAFDNPTVPDHSYTRPATLGQMQRPPAHTRNARTPCYTLLNALVASFLLAAGPLWAAAPTNQFPSVRRGVLIQRHRYDPLTDNLRVAHNEPENLLKEIQEPGFRKLLTQILQAPDEASLGKMEVKTYGIEIDWIPMDDKRITSLQSILEDYFDSRVSGHTTNYAWASLKQRLIQSPPETNAFRATLFQKFPYLPRQWVRVDPFEPTAYPMSEKTISKNFLLIDGEIAWTYLVTPAFPLGSGDVYELKVDAQEFDPKLRPKFQAATKEAEQNLSQSGFKPGRRGYGAALWEEKGRILLRDYGIKCLDYRALNPNIRFD
jgi:hypothetical protein